MSNYILTLPPLLLPTAQNMMEEGRGGPDLIEPQKKVPGGLASLEVTGSCRKKWPCFAGQAEYWGASLRTAKILAEETGPCRKKWACFAQQRYSVSYGILKKEYRGASFRSALVVKSGHASLGKVVLLAIGHTQKKSTGRPRFALQKSWLSLYASIVLKGNSLLSAGIFLCVCGPPPPLLKI